MLGPNDPALQLVNDLDRRVQLTLSSRETDVIDKVPGAGGFLEIDGVPVQVMHNGVLVVKDGYLGPWQTAVIASLHGHHEPQEEVLFHAVLERLAETGGGASMVELGAWWSYYSLWFKHRFSESVIVGIEPDLPFLETGRKNYALNGVDDSLLLHGVVGPQPGELLSFIAASDGLPHEVRQYGLPELLDLAKVSSFDLVLADIQGAELTFLDTSGESLAEGSVRFLFISTHDPIISGSATTHGEVLHRVQELGGHIVAEHSVSESLSGDGLIVASFDLQDRDFSVEISRARARDSLFGEWEPRLAVVLQERDEARARVEELERQLEHRQ